MEVKRYLSLIWRWAWLVVLGIIISGGGAFIISKNMTAIYQASSRLLIDEAPGGSGGNEYSQLLVAQRLAQTYVEIMNTRPIQEEVVDRLDLPFGASTLASKIAISVPPETQILVITVQDTDPGRAADIANTLGQVFIDQNKERENMRYAEPIANWQNQLAQIGDEIETLEADINAFGTPESAEDQAQLSRKETQLNEAQIRYTDAFNNLNQLQIEQAKETSNVVQIEPAQPPQYPVRPRVIANTLLAALTGGLLALGLVLLIDYLDDTIKTSEQILADTGLSTLGTVAYIKGRTFAERLITSRKPRDPISEAFRVLRTNLSFSAVDGDLQSLIITSASPSEGKSTTTANLAVVMAQTGKRVLIVDADLRRPTQHNLFELPNNQGLTTAILDNKTPVNYHIQKTRVPNLHILTSGPIPPNPSELLNSQRMSHILKALTQETDFVIFDTPPVLTVADASILAPQVDGGLLVIEVGKTTSATFKQAVERIKNTGATLFGVVMNQLQPGRSSSYGYYYYNYGAPENHKKRGWRNISLKLPGWLSVLNRR